MAGDSLPGVNMARLRHYVALAVEGQQDEELRTALTAALERGDAALIDLGDEVGVKVMGRQLAKIHKSRLRGDS